jgi:hypothetical protein
VNDAELREWRSRLRINKHRLDDELEVQAESQETIAQKVQAAEARMMEAKEDLQKTEARLVEDFREGGRAAGATKDLAEAKARRHPDRMRAWERFQAASQEHRAWADLLEAWRNKGRDLHALGKLFSDDYYSLTAKSVYAERPSRDSRPPSERYERPNTRRQAEASPELERALTGLLGRGKRTPLED